MTFVFEVKNANIAKKSKIAGKNAQNNAFVTFVFFESNVASVLLKSIAINIWK